ncbi:MAG TPA: tetratricopeptide repeat protein [Treponemataceae bacterium]|jgi:tetratricopeptide (TPR) repeat protein|nr:tetratricopeptide repeat protein [Treponemataceae bacterium]
MQENPETLNTQAIELASQGDYPEAIACFKRAIAIERENYLLWFNMGVTYRDLGDLEGAKQALLQANAINPDDEEVMETLALIYFSLGQTELALDTCIDTLDINPNNAHIWNTIGVLHFSKSNYQEACTSFERAVTLYPHYYDALYNLRDTYTELGNKQGALECNDRLKKLTAPGAYYA